MIKIYDNDNVDAIIRLMTDDEDDVYMDFTTKTFFHPLSLNFRYFLYNPETHHNYSRFSIFSVSSAYLYTLI